MSTATMPEHAEATAASPLDRPYRLGLDQYERMIEAGIFGDRDKVFLWKGRLVEPMSKNPPHFLTTRRLFLALDRCAPAGYFVGQEFPVAIPDDGMPEPDLAVIRGRDADYLGRRPTTRDVPLIVEVSDSSLAFDQGEVLRTYAAQAVPVYWIVNLPGRRVEVHSDPTGPADIPAYRTCRYYGPGDEVPVVLDGREVARLPVANILLDPEPTPPA